MLLEMMISLMDSDTCTMVLSSALNAFCELCPTRLDLLHTSYRKICHLLTDMDEWGQVVIIDLLARYCRQFFKEPRGWKAGTAERIDRERRVRRKMTGSHNMATTQQEDNVGSALDAFTESTTGTTTVPRKTKRRVVQKGFYSDEEDNSTEEEDEVYNLEGTTSAGGQRNILGLPGVGQQPSSMIMAAVNMNAEEDMDLDEDHKLLLQCANSLLKSRNAGVVLSVCSLLYYCGVSSVKARSAIGKALVRIHRDRREIQYVVLTSIRTLVVECPSAFAPFLHDFFVKVSGNN
jgi:AP-3 complex subunit beta